MKTGLIAPFAAVAGLVVAQPAAAACPPGYERVKIQGHWICKIKTPDLPLTAKKKYQPTAPSGALKSR